TTIESVSLICLLAPSLPLFHTLSLHDALPIFRRELAAAEPVPGRGLQLPGARAVGQPGAGCRAAPGVHTRVLVLGPSAPARGWAPGGDLLRGGVAARFRTLGGPGRARRGHHRLTAGPAGAVMAIHVAYVGITAGPHGPSCPHFTGSPRIFVTDTRLIDPSAPGSRSEERAAHQKRTLVVLVIMQVIGAVGVGVAV